jgi:hypothetical protein
VNQPAIFHPVQLGDMRLHPCVPEHVALRAYDVYKHLFHEQPAMVTGGCRGGFGVGELVAMLYARSFPKHEWQARFDEALSRPSR